MVDLDREFPHRDAWTVRLGAASSSKELVILVPPKTSIALGFERARTFVREGRVVRIVAREATSAPRPAWMEHVVGTLFLTELESYRPVDRSDDFSALLPSAEAWLRATLDVVEGHDPSQVFWLATNEILFAAVEDVSLARCIVRVHAADDLECVDPRWATYRAIRALRGDAESSRGSWRARFLLAWLAYLPASLAKRTVEYVRQAPIRDRVRSWRDRSDTPVAWLGLVGSSLSVSRTLLELLPMLELRDGETVGVLLQSNLERGLRTSAFSRDYDPTPLLPSLDAEALKGRLSRVEQGISAESISALCSTLAETVWRSARAAMKIALHPPTLSIDGVSIAVAEDVPRAVAKLCTLDALRAIEAVDATERLLRRVDFRDAIVMSGQCTWPNDAIVADELAKRGAQTVGLEHGGLCETALNFGNFRVSAKARAMWTLVEAEALQPHEPRQTILGGYLPRILPRRSTAPREDHLPTVRVLVASNYLPAPWSGDLEKWQAYQGPLLAAGEELRRDPAIELRWRPHPSDDPKRIASFRERFETYQTSTGSLHDDLDWCDVFVTSLSSTIVEALFYDVPIFVHDIPLQSEIIRRAIPEQRLFGPRVSLASTLQPVIAALRARHDVLAPERQLRALLFGERGVPRSPRELLDPRTFVAAATHG